MSKVWELLDLITFKYQYFFYSSFTAATCADIKLAKNSFSLELEQEWIQLMTPAKGSN